MRAGKGGNGVLSYYTDKRVRKGAPDGGDGGSGGDIVIQAHKSMHDLSHLRLKTIEGVDGQHGGTTDLRKALLAGKERTEVKPLFVYPVVRLFTRSNWKRRKRCVIFWWI